MVNITVTSNGCIPVGEHDLGWEPEIDDEQQLGGIFHTRGLPYIRDRIDGLAGRRVDGEGERRHG